MRALGRWALTAGMWCTVFDVASGQPVGPSLHSTRGSAFTTMSPDGQWVAWGGPNSLPASGTPTLPEIDLARVESGQQALLRGTRPSMTVQESLAFSWDGQQLAALNWYGGALEVFTVATGRLLSELTLGEHARLLSFTDDGLAIRVSRDEAQKVQTIRWQDGALLDSWTLPAGVGTSSADGTVATAVDPDWRTVTVSRQGTVIGTMPALRDSCFGGIPGAMLTPDGSLVLLDSACSRPQSSTRMWPLTELRDAATGTVIQEIASIGLAFSGDARMFVSGATLWCKSAGPEP